MAKEITSEYPVLRSSLFQKMDLPETFTPATLSRSGAVFASLEVSRHGLILSYRITGGGILSNVHDRIDFDWTCPAYGGQRVWFLCPRCGRRCGVLYLGQRVACRKCLDLAYPCEMERFTKGWALHQRWLSRIKDGKPKRMRWRTYDKLQAKVAERAVSRIQPFLASMRRRGFNGK